MNRKNTLLVVLSTLLIFSPLVSFYKVLPTARATYVEGTITQNTDWTLVDSPFILSNNITVNSGVALTIEPGVQIRFGEDFSLTVYGRIIADGTDERMIRFTSNSLNANMGDWGTILIISADHSSITHCIIEYATNGVTLESGSLNLQDSLVKSNFNGTVINGGDATIMDNVISANGDGVELTGNLNGNVNIARNNIAQCERGIVLGAESYSNTVIVQNNVSSNIAGFHVMSSTSTYIARNYISNNTNGIYYENGVGHKAHFNDIYNNTMGIDLSSTASVNATNNYWGDETGPFHGYLNPAGKGNKVGGNGVNLLFIFFLSVPIDYNNQSPIAFLQTDKTLVAPNQYVTFIGANSHDDGRVDQYLYDFGDGANSGWTTLSLLNHTYSSVGTYIATLTVMDDFGSLSRNLDMVTITVQNLTPLTVSMASSSSVVDYHGNVTVTVYVSTVSGAAANATVLLLSAKGGSYSPPSGVTDANGLLETTFTAPNVTDTTDVRLIARASHSGYADGSCYTYLKVLPILHIWITTEPSTVKSEATVAMIFKVTGELGQPIADASLTATVDNGTLSTGSGITGADGTLLLNYSAPYTLSPMNVTISASAQEPGFTDGYDQETISVLPKMLVLQLTADTDSTVSEANVNVTAFVTYDLFPVPDVNVTITSQNNIGNFAETAGTTDSQGFAAFIFTAPQANAPLDIVLTAIGTHEGYADGQGSFTVNVNPGNISVQIVASSYETEPGSNVILTVTALAGSNPAVDAQVIISASAGSFPYTSSYTNQDGTCSFTFNAPSENVQIPVIITANVTKNGYIGNGNQTTINVNPVAPTQSGEGLPWITMLLIIVPVVIAVVVVVVLIKRKLIVVSTGEESASK